MVDGLGRRVGDRIADSIELVAILIGVVVEIIAVVLDVLDRHLRLRGGNDAIVVLGVLKVVFSHHPVAGALRVTCQGSVFLGDLLSRAADLHVRAIALIVAGQRVRALAVVVVIIIATAAIVVATAHAPVLLLWPHQTLFILKFSKSPTRTEALMRPAVSFLHRRSPASIALAPRVILFRLHHLPDDSRTKLGRRFRKKAAISKEDRIAKSTACFVSSG